MSQRPAFVHVLVNPAAGQDKAVLAILTRTFEEAGIDWRATVMPRGRSVRELVEAVLEGPEPPDWLVVSGGDGTVSEAASVMAGRKTPLAILPGGTGNVIAQELGLSLDYEEAARALFLGATEGRMLDLIDAGGRHCILRAGLGADVRMMASADREAKDQLGWAAYLRAAIDEVAHETLTRLRVEADGAVFEADVLTALVLNTSRLGRGGAVLSRRIRPDDRALDLLLIRRGSIAAILQVLRAVLDVEGELPRSATGAPGDESLVVEHVVAPEITVTPLGAMEFQVDGDVRPAIEPGCSVRFRIEPARAVFVAPLVPAVVP